MFRGRDFRMEFTTDDSGERLLAEEEGTPWTKNEESSTKVCKGFAASLSQFTALLVFFFIGALIGFGWRGDLDDLCGAYVSQYCKNCYELALG